MIASLMKKLSEEKKQHRNKLKNLRAVVYKEAIDFVKEKTKVANDAMTKNHKGIVQRFIDYKRLTNNNFTKLEERLQAVQKEEMEFSLIAPV